MTKSNSLCNAYVVNTNPLSAYAGFRITTMLELADPDGGTFIEPVTSGEEYLDLLPEALDDPIYRVSAKYKQGYHRDSRVLADFYNIKEASLFLTELTGSSVDIYSY
tara:strand:- start:78 stop:398 length:321 start_codon:yes stop_codon:yes gene_type:complete